AQHLDAALYATGESMNFVECSRIERRGPGPSHLRQSMLDVLPGLLGVQWTQMACMLHTGLQVPQARVCHERTEFWLTGEADSNLHALFVRQVGQCDETPQGALVQ